MKLKGEFQTASGMAKLEDAAAMLMRYVESKQPDWARQLHLFKTERKLTAKQVLGMSLADVCRRGVWSMLPLTTAFDDDAVEARGTVAACTRCGRPFTRRWLGQAMCGLADCAAPEPLSVAEPAALPDADELTD